MKNTITVHVSTNIMAPVPEVWKALTTPEIIKKYFFGTNAISDWRPGSALIFKGEWEGKKYEDKGTILSMIPDRLFQYTYWSSMSGIEDKPENYVTITYDLTENKDGTVLTVTQENIPDVKTKEHSEQNWKKVLADLKQLLEKKTVNSLT